MRACAHRWRAGLHRGWRPTCVPVLTASEPTHVLAGSRACQRADSRAAAGGSRACGCRLGGARGHQHSERGAAALRGTAHAAAGTCERVQCTGGGTTEPPPARASVCNAPAVTAPLPQTLQRNSKGGSAPEQLGRQRTVAPATKHPSEVDEHTIHHEEKKQRTVARNMQRPSPAILCTRHRSTSTGGRALASLCRKPPRIDGAGGAAAATDKAKAPMPACWRRRDTGGSGESEVSVHAGGYVPHVEAWKAR